MRRKINLAVFKKTTQLLVVLVMLTLLSACIGTVVGAVVDTTIEIVKVPFKVGGAVIDVVTPDDLAEQTGANPKRLDGEQDAVDLESEGL